jgi:hypothetical protein
LRALPLEVMFIGHIVRRSMSFVHILIRHAPVTGCPRVCVPRWREVAAHYFKAGVRRSCEEVQRFVGFGRLLRPLHGEGKYCYPCPLFASNRESSAYQAKYPFCEIVDVRKDLGMELRAAFFILSYADFCEMPVMAARVMQENLGAFFMFIPAGAIRDAFKAMLLMFQRQEERVQFVQDHRGSMNDYVKIHANVCEPHEFVPALQATLIEQLGCPVPIIVPTY